MKVIVVFSALHTGTWFTVEFLRTTGDVQHLADARFVDGFGLTIENLPLSLSFDERFERSVIEYASEYFQPETFQDGLILQAHNRSEDSNLFQSILAKKPRIPVVVPMRDPILSINSRLWRECKTEGELRKRPKELREFIMRDQLSSMKNLFLRIPDYHVFLLPVDLMTREDVNSRRQLLVNLLSYCDLPEPHDLDDFAVAWRPIRSTEAWHEKNTKEPVESKPFQDMKQHILNGEADPVRQFYEVEWSILEQEKELRERLEALGYHPLW